MRGKDDVFKHHAAITGITPAHAGKSPDTVCWKRRGRDHPRACGEKKFFPSFSLFASGSPPRMRGKVLPPLCAPVNAGITPAHAGKSRRYDRQKPVFGDHPRACGEKLDHIEVFKLTEGSPPRMRGKGGIPDSINVMIGITPAHAGKR